MESLRALIDQVAQSSATLLIRGESGPVRKSSPVLFMRKVLGPMRPSFPLTAARFPLTSSRASSLAIERGPLRGAADRLGRFQLAHGGTLFLDEIGDMPAYMQVKLLRSFRSGRLSPSGARPEAVDVRVVAATHRILSRRLPRAPSGKISITA